MLQQLQKTIDRVIKEIWVSNVSKDYDSYYLLKEDSLKNALYYHLRTKLNKLLIENNFRIYTEYHYKGFIADLAIVKLTENPGNNHHLKDDVEAVLAIVEIKYKSGWNAQPFMDDIQKIKSYLEKTPKDTAQYYLGFVHEIQYENIEGDSWLTKSQQKWAKGRLTEMSGHYIGDEMVWNVLSYNGMNEDFEWRYRFTREELEDAASSFNEAKYSHELYHHFLDVVSREEGVTENLRDAVKYLIYWKLGKVSTTRTSASEEIEIEGHTFYVSGGTASHSNFIEKAITKEMLKYGLKFRDGQLSYTEFKGLVAQLTKTSIVLPAFFIHTWKPSEYPILDVKVWRTYKWNKGDMVKKYTKPNSWNHYEEYTDFFRGLVKDSDLDWRNVDKGLWGIGDGLKEESVD